MTAKNLTEISSNEDLMPLRILQNAVYSPHEFDLVTHFTGISKYLYKCKWIFGRGTSNVYQVTNFLTPNDINIVFMNKHHEYKYIIHATPTARDVEVIDGLTYVHIDNYYDVSRLIKTHEKLLPDFSRAKLKAPFSVHTTKEGSWRLGHFMTSFRNVKTKTIAGIHRKCKTCGLYGVTNCPDCSTHTLGNTHCVIMHSYGNGMFMLPYNINYNLEGNRNAGDEVYFVYRLSKYPSPKLTYYILNTPW
jgi:hypothetical protein